MEILPFRREILRPLDTLYRPGDGDTRGEHSTRAVRGHPGVRLYRADGRVTCQRPIVPNLILCRRGSGGSGSQRAG